MCLLHLFSGHSTAAIFITAITMLVIGIEREDLREIFHVDVFAGRSPVEPLHSERLSFHGRCIFMQRVSYLRIREIADLSSSGNDCEPCYTELPAASSG